MTHHTPDPLDDFEATMNVTPVSGPVERRVEIVFGIDARVGTHREHRENAVAAALQVLNEHAIVTAGSGSTHATSPAVTFRVTFASEVEIDGLALRAGNEARQWVPCDVIVRKPRR